jgi:glycerol-3-phosphate acyltransferase PlsY
MSKLLLRKTWRLFGIIFPLIYYFGSKRTTLIAVSPVLCIFLLIEFLRFTIPAVNHRLFIFLRSYFKETEKKRLITTTTFLISFLITVLFFRKDIAITAMLFSIFGDAASAIVGVHGKKKIFGKSIEGSLAFFVTCLAIGLVLTFTKISLAPAVFISGAFVATIIELLPLPVDDNFTISLAAGAVMSVMLKFL